MKNYTEKLLSHPRSPSRACQNPGNLSGGKAQQWCPLLWLSRRSYSVQELSDFLQAATFNLILLLRSSFMKGNKGIETTLFAGLTCAWRSHNASVLETNREKLLRVPALTSITCWQCYCICVFINIFSACGHLTLCRDHQFLVTALKPQDSKWTVKIARNSCHLPPWINICISFWCSWAMVQLQSHFQVSEYPASTPLIMQKKKKKISALWMSLSWERHMHFYLTYRK